MHHSSGLRLGCVATAREPYTRNRGLNPWYRPVAESNADSEAGDCRFAEDVDFIKVKSRKPNEGRFWETAELATGLWRLVSGWSKLLITWVCHLAAAGTKDIGGGGRAIGQALLIVRRPPL